jgi:RNA polymerase sigma factor (sigma-70 family)
MDEEKKSAAEVVDEPSDELAPEDRPKTPLNLRVTSSLATMGVAVFYVLPVSAVVVAVSVICAAIGLITPTLVLDAAAIDYYSFEYGWLHTLYLGGVAWRTSARLWRRRVSEESERVGLVRPALWSAVEVFTLLFVVHVVLGFAGEVNAPLAQWTPFAGALLTFVLVTLALWSVARAATRGLHRLTDRSPRVARAWSAIGLGLTAIPLTLLVVIMEETDARSADPYDSTPARVASSPYDGALVSYEEAYADLDEVADSFGVERVSRLERCLEEVMGAGGREGYVDEAAAILASKFRAPAAEAHDLARDVSIKVCERHRDTRINVIRDYYFKAVEYEGIDYVKKRGQHRRHCEIERRRSNWDPVPRASGEFMVVRMDVERVYANLTEQDQTLFDLRFMQELSSCEIGEALGVSPVAARKRVSRLRDVLIGNLSR